MAQDALMAAAAGSLVLADYLRSAETNAERKHKKARVTALKLRLLRGAFPRQASRLRRSADALRLLRGEWMAADARAFMVDLGFSNPFAPYELEFRQTDLTGALQKVGRALGLDEAMVDRLRAVQRQVGDSARPASWRSVALV